jgi:hypothetical protein
MPDRVVKRDPRVASGLRSDKVCAACGRAIAWRKKWERDWDNVKYCGSACRRAGVSATDRALEEATARLLAARAPGGTICPSEAARAVDPDNWRELMEPARRAARRMVAAGRAAILQRGRLVDPSTARGPIRVGSPR